MASEFIGSWAQSVAINLVVRKLLNSREMTLMFGAILRLETRSGRLLMASFQRKGPQ